MTEGALARNQMKDTSLLLVYFHFIEKTPQQQAFIWGELSGIIYFLKNLIYRNPSSKSSSNCKIEVFMVDF